MIDRSIKWWGHYNPSMIRYEFQAIQTTEDGRRAIYTIFETELIDAIATTSRGPTLALEPEASV